MPRIEQNNGLLLTGINSLSLGSTSYNQNITGDVSGLAEAVSHNPQALKQLLQLTEEKQSLFRRILSKSLSLESLIMTAGGWYLMKGKFRSAGLLGALVGHGLGVGITSLIDGLKHKIQKMVDNTENPLLKTLGSVLKYSIVALFVTIISMGKEIAFLSKMKKTGIKGFISQINKRIDSVEKKLGNFWTKFSRNKESSRIVLPHIDKSITDPLDAPAFYKAQLDKYVHNLKNNKDGLSPLRKNWMLGWSYLGKLFLETKDYRVWRKERSLNAKVLTTDIPRIFALNVGAFTGLQMALGLAKQSAEAIPLEAIEDRLKSLMKSNPDAANELASSVYLNSAS